MSRKHRYAIDLTEPPRPNPARIAARPITRADIDALAELMLDAYVDTIDYEGEDLEDARSEVTRFFDADPVLDHSLVVASDLGLASAVLVTMEAGLPLIAYVMTRRSTKRSGMARALVEASLSGLATAGHATVTLYITEGNVPSESLFAGLGASRTD